MSYSDVAIYKINLVLTTFCIFLLLPLGLIIKPILAEANADKNYNKIQKLIFLPNILSFLTFILFSTLIYTQSDLLIELIFGGEFISNKNLILIFLFGFFFNSYYAFSGTVMIMMGHEKVIIKYLLYSILLNILMSILLFSFFNLYSFAIGISLSMYLWNYLSYKFIKNEYNIDVSLTYSIVYIIKKYENF